MINAAIKVLLLLKHRLVIQSRESMMKGANGQLQTPLQDRLLQLIRAHDVQLKTSIRVVAPVQRDSVGKRCLRAGGEAVHRSYLEKVGQATMQRRCSLTKAIDIVK
ncbi:hypothetical protein D3C84_736310 [compost metagenome]